MRPTGILSLVLAVLLIRAVRAQSHHRAAERGALRAVRQDHSHVVPALSASRSGGGREWTFSRKEARGFS